MYSSYSFLTPALDGVSGQRHALAALYLRIALDRWLGGPQNWCGHRDYIRGSQSVGLPTPGGPFDCMRIMYILNEIRVQGTIYSDRHFA
jgi:hypothetical protein